MFANAFYHVGAPRVYRAFGVGIAFSMRFISLPPCSFLRVRVACFYRFRVTRGIERNENEIFRAIFVIEGITKILLTIN